MEWNNIKRWFGRESRPGGDADEETTGISWLDAAANPWGLPVLDVRPVTLELLSTSQDPRCAENAVSFGQDDGTGFVGEEPAVARTVTANLQYRCDPMVADGALFIPREMEQKWALYFHGRQILCIRSWLRQVRAVAEVQIAEDRLEVTTLRGTFLGPDEEPDFSVRVLDYLLRSHALDLVYPAPLPAGMAADPRQAALWCFASFGNRAHFATPHPMAMVPPDKPLRTDSLLHIAVARGDLGKARALLDGSMPVDLMARDGLAPLHWSLVHDDTAISRLLLERGSAVDVRSAEGATPLMNAVQAGRVTKAAFLLDEGADPNATDQRGFTALHRAAEMGQKEIVQLLLDRGAAPHPEAQGHTPRSLAETRGHQAIVELLAGS